MKLLLTVLCASSILACKEEPKIDYAILTGTVSNTAATKALLKNADFEKEIALQADGKFSDTLRLPDNGFYSLTIGRESTALYLKNGDSLNLTVDTTQFDESLSYSGDGAMENNYLVKKYLNNEAALNDAAAFYALEEAPYKAKLQEMKNANLSALDGMENVDANFIATEKKNLVYDEYAMLNNYERLHARFTENPEFKMSDNFMPEELKTMTFDDADAYKMSQSYKQMAMGKTLDDLFDALGDDYQNASAEDLKPIAELKIQALKNDIIDYLGGFLVSPGNENMEGVYAFFKENTTKETTKKKLTETYEKNKDLVKGKPSPMFVDYENHKGGQVSLEDLKGKYVYVDVWATWCGPCIREIPSLKEVEKQFHGQNIEFVSTSIDKAADHEKWVAMVKDKELGGMQLMADNDWQSQFVRDYVIEGIPSFILIDPN